MLATSLPGAHVSTGPRTALLVAHLAAVLFGLTGILGALIQADASVITFGRAAIAFIALGFVAGLKGTRLLDALTWRNLPVILLTGTLLAVHWVAFFVAVKVGGVAMATLGFAAFPAFIALIDVLVFRDRLGALDALLLMLVSTGLVLVVPSFGLFDQGTLGLAWGLASGLAFAVLTVVNRRRDASMDALQTAFWQNGVVAMLVGPVALGASGALQLGGDDWTHLILLGVFCTGMAQLLFVKSLEGLQARTAGMIIALEPVYAIAGAWWLFSEPPSLRMLCGALVIVLATLLSAPCKAPAH
ncbi:DMT family transporter [Pseudomonas entomophila]|jgi:drug/metabolite transporter (DMT)-like permease|uniref:DMT family transporter n=1 Tax=Pseudomonas entomophila TaxID=312306 RepID=UPI0015E32850|nr:DMT family transporter [Pseudomonas entomophila]MBA1193937.1 DMT family transporter [Pseudomonas entomophila]